MDRLIEILVGASGNFVGGLLVTVLWFWVTGIRQRIFQKGQLAQTIKVARLEISRLKSLTDRLASADISVEGWTPVSAAALTAVLRLGPRLIDKLDFEPVLAAVERRLEELNALRLRHLLDTSGAAQALRGNEADVAVILERIRSTSADLSQELEALDCLLDQNQAR